MKTSHQWAEYPPLTPLDYCIGVVVLGVIILYLCAFGYTLLGL